MNSKDPTTKENITITKWLAALAYLVDTFESFNIVNIMLQCNDANALELKDKVNLFGMKIDLWMDKLEKNNFAYFPQLNTFIDENEVTVEAHLKSVTKEHLCNIKYKLVL